MLHEPQKPIKEPYLKSMDIFYLSKFWYESKKIAALESLMNKKPICWCCKGDGKVKDFTQRCVVEGLKHADLIPCPLCAGNGIMYMEFIYEEYKIELGYYKKKLKKYRDDMIIYNSILKKLDEEELEWLKKC